MNKILRYVSTLFLAMVLASRGIVAVIASENDGKTDPVGLFSRSTFDSLEEESNDDGDDDDDDNDEPALASPILQATVSGRSVELSWTAVAGAARYALWAWESVNGWRQLGGENLTGASLTDSEVVPGTVYYYAIRAVNAEGESSAWSAYVHASVGEGLPFGTAPGLTAVAGDGMVELSWDAVSGAVRYALWAWESVDGWQKIGGDNLTSTSFVHSSAAVGVTYFYAVRAVNGSGDGGPWSKYAQVTVAASTSAGIAGGDTDNDGYDTPATDYDGIDTPATDYDGIDTPATDNDGVDTPLSTDNDGVNTPYTDYDGIDTTDNDGIDTTDNDGIDTTDNDGIDTTDNDGIDTTDGDGVDTTDNDGIDTTDNDGIDTTDGDGVDTTDNDGVDTTDNDGIDTTDGDGVDTTDNDGTDSDGIDTPTPTDNDGTDSDGIDTPTPTDSGDSDVSS